MAAIPSVLRLHRSRLAEKEIETMDGIRVTTPLRTLIDVIRNGSLSPEFQVQAVDQALRRGLVMRRQLEQATVSVRTRQRIKRILNQVQTNDDATSVRDSRRAARRS